MVENNDWRLRGQERYLKGVTLVFKPYLKYREDWDHDHCDFCGAKFMEQKNDKTLNEGYTTEDDYHWVCTRCFNDFKKIFRWKVAP